MNRLKLLALAGLSLLALSACTSNKNEAAKDPVTAAKDIAVAMRDNDYGRLSHIMVPPDLYAKLETRYKDENAKKPAPSADQEKQFADSLAKFTASDAEDKMFAQIQPQLAQMGPQIPMYVAMGTGGLGQMIASSDKMSAPEKAQANAVVNAISKWAQAAHLDDQDKAKQAIKVVVGTARDLKLTTLDAMQKLSFSEMTQKVGVAAGGLRKTLAVYGFDTDKALDSVKVEKKSEDGDNAMVTISYTLLDTPISFEEAMVKVDGRWYNKSLVDSLKSSLDKPADAPAAPVADAPVMPAADAAPAPATSAMSAPSEQPSEQPAESDNTAAPASSSSAPASGG